METKLGISNRGDLRQRIGYKDNGKLQGAKMASRGNPNICNYRKQLWVKCYGNKREEKRSEEVRRGPHIHAGAQNLGRVWLAGAGTFKREQRNWFGECQMKLGTEAIAILCCCFSCSDTNTKNRKSPSTSLHLPMSLQFSPLTFHQLIGSHLAKVSQKHSLQTLTPASQSRT